MSLPIIGSLISTIAQTATDIIGTEKDKLDYQLKSRELDLRSDQNQVDINKIEAASDNIWKSGWRPAVGWVCVLGLFYEFIVMPILPWVLTVCGINNVPPLPKINDNSLDTLLYAMLGLGSMRTIEKVKPK